MQWAHIPTALIYFALNARTDWSKAGRVQVDIERVPLERVADVWHREHGGAWCLVLIP
jgi:hypothetical protein